MFSCCEAKAVVFFLVLITNQNLIILLMKTLVLRLRTGFAALAMLLVFGNINAETLENSGTTLVFAGDGRKPASMGAGLSWESKATADVTAPGNYLTVNTNAINGDGWSNFSCIQVNNQTAVRANVYLVFQVRLATGKNADNLYIFPKDNAYPDQPANNSGSLKKLSDYTCNGAVLSTTADTWVVIPWTNSSTFFRMSFLDPDGALLLKDFYIATSNPTCISNLDKPVVTAVSAGCDRINLSWDAVEDALHYRILTVNGASGKDTAFVAQQTGTSYSHTGIRANTAYSYKILAISADGKSLSDAASATTAASDNPSPAISAAVPDYTSITLTLTPQPGAVSNMLYRGTSPADITTPTAYIGGTSFTDTGLDEGIAYYYRLVSTFASSCPTEATRKATTLLHVAYPPTLLDCSASACRQQLAGYINFAPKDGNETGRWDIDNIHYYGLANETLKTSATYRSTGKLTSDEYFIVKNPSTEYNTNNNGGADIPLQDIPNALGGVFVVRKGGDQTLRYTISGLESNQNYCVRIRMRNIGRPGADGSDISSPCNENGNNVRIDVVSTADGRSKSNGVYTTTNTGDCTTNSTQNGWGQQNAMRRYGDLTVFTGTVNTGNTDNFQLDIRGIGEYRNTMTGIETIEVYGCIPEPELTADKYTIDAGEEVTLKALKFACAESPAYLWSIVGGASLSETAQAIKVYPETTTTYRVECDGITRDTTITVRKNITSSSGLSFCEGKSSTLKANGIGLDSDTYIWTEKRGTYAAVTLPAQGREINITPSYIGTIIYTATNAKPGGETLTVTITVKDCCLDGTQFSISKVCNPLTVDGIANEPEWGVSPWVQVNKGSSGALSPNPAAQWKMLYDDDGFIYVFVRVYDDSNPANNYWNQPGNTGCSGVHCGYNGDAVEIYFDAGAGKCSGYPLQIGLMYPRRSADASPASPVTYTEANGNGKYNNQQCSGVSFAGYEATVIPWNATSKYWDVEFKFPAMANGVDLNQDSIRLEVGVNQSSNGSSRSAQGHTWTAAADMYANRNKLHWTQLGDCASARASKETVCDGGTTELSTRMRINTIGVDEETAYTWQVCATGCADNSVGNPAWQNISPELENTGNTITVSPNFGANTTLFYRAIYDDQQGGQVTTCPIAISKGTLTASASADPAVFCAGSGKISIEGDFDTHGGIMPNLQWGWKKAAVNDIAVADWVSGYGLSGSEERKTLEISPIAASDGGFYFFVVSGDCEAASGGVAITVSDILEINKTVTSVCIDKTIDLTHANSGTTWISRTPAVATVTAGIVRGISAGQVWIINKNAAGCTDSVQITVSAIPVINKTVTQVCVGATINLTHANSGTSWISRNTGTATVAAGVVQGVAAGQVWILNENATGCADSVQVTVYALPTAVISGDTTICKGGNTANKVKITFTGKAPFKFTYSDATTASGEI